MRSEQTKISPERENPKKSAEGTAEMDEIRKNIMGALFTKIDLPLQEFLNATIIHKEKDPGRFLDAVLQNFGIFKTALQNEACLSHALHLLNRIAKEMAGTEASRRALAAIIENREKLEATLHGKVAEDTIESLLSFDILLKFGDAQERTLGAETLLKNFDTILSEAKNKNLPYHIRLEFWSLLSSFLRIGKFEQERDAKKAMLEAMETDDEEQQSIISRVLCQMLVSDFMPDQFFARYAIEEFLQKYISNPHELIRQWFENDDGAPATIELNLRAIRSLEQQRSGIAYFLKRQFGLLDFRDNFLAHRTYIQKYDAFKAAQKEGKPYSPWLEEETVFKKYGLNFSDFLEAWRDALPQNVLQTAIATMETVGELEAQCPGSARALHEEFGIKNFARYPVELLEKQYEERNNTALPYGIILYPRNDHNGTFSEDQLIFEKLAKDLGKNFALRVIEAKSKYQIARAFVSLDKRYGKHHKISFAIVGGHGDPDAIRFGRETRPEEIFSTGDIFRGRGVRRIGKFFEQNPTLILVSCSTGVQRGIAEQISKTMKARVFAPDIPTNIRSIKPTFVGGRLTFMVEYTKPKSARLYTSGRLSTDEKLTAQ